MSDLTSRPRSPRSLSANSSESLSASVIACAIVTLTLAGAVVGSRFYTRGRMQSAGLWREDWSILIAWFLSLGYTIAVIIGCHHGMGSHIWTIQPHDLMLSMRAAWVSVIFYQLCLAFAKISILFLYIRVFQYQITYRAAWVMLVVVIICSIWGFVSIITPCVPLEAYWDPSIEGTCKPISYMWAILGMHVATDFLIFFIPLPVVYKIKIPTKSKIGLFVVFSLGFFVCLISIIRIVMVYQSAPSTDFTWDYGTVWKWTSIEVNTAIVVSCLIVLRPLLRRLFPQLFSIERELADRTGGTVGGLPACDSPRPTAAEYGGDISMGSQGALLRGDVLIDSEWEASSDRRRNKIQQPARVYMQCSSRP